MRRDMAYFIDIAEAAKLALSYVSNMTLEQFLEDIQCQDSVIRRLEIIGEAARRISEESRRTYPDLPWKEMTGMRNLLIHDYDEVDMYLVWQTVQKDLPDLLSRIEKAIN